MGYPGDQLEVFVDVEYNQPCEFAIAGDDRIWNGWRPVVPEACERFLDLDSTRLDSRGRVLRKLATQVLVTRQPELGGVRLDGRQDVIRHVANQNI